MRTRLALLCLSLTACGGRVQGEATPTDTVASDAAVDTFRQPPPRDTGTARPDTRPPPEGCAVPLGPGFACTEPEPRAGKTVCNDAMMQTVVDGCFGETATSASCEAAQKKYTACANCMLSDWIVDGRLAVAQCIQKIDPKSSCVLTVECTYDCLDEVCYNCDYEPGTGTGGGSEMDDCWANEAEGQCEKPAREYTACVSDPKFSVCYPSTIADVLPFYRGACRDGGNWSRAYEPDTVVDAATGG